MADTPENQIHTYLTSDDPHWITVKRLHYICLDIHRPVHWLFEGGDGGAYSERRVQAIFIAAKERSGINPLATTHTLCHSVATHLPEIGMDLQNIQKLLGMKTARRQKAIPILRKKLGPNKKPA